MGFALARAAFEAGAEVTLVAGPAALPTPRGVNRINVGSADEMLQVCLEHSAWASVFIAAAAVADWRPAHIEGRKIKKQATGAPPVLDYVETTDILHTLANSVRAQSGALFCVGFAAESEDLLVNATAKRRRKGVPLLVGNIGPETFGQDDNALLLVDDSGAREIPRASKQSLARVLVREIASRLAAPAAATNETIHEN
jgi:phosphopantothenoylcysteine decarboxylase/phosphopantothenate--cysteine ligase